MITGRGDICPKFHKRQNDRNGWYTLADFSEKFKKVKSQNRKNVVFGKFCWKHSKIVLFWVLWLPILTFFAPDYIDHSGHLMFYEFFWRQNFYNSFSFNCLKLNISAIYKSIIHHLWIFLRYWSTSFKRKNSNPTTRRTSKTT